MVRPRGFEHEEVAEALLDTFWLRGYARTSIPNLTEATGLLPGSLYAAFGSKEDMFRLAVERYIARIRAALTTGVKGAEGIQSILDTVVRITVADPDRRGCLVLNAIPESTTLSEETRADLQTGLKEMRRLLRDRLREAQTEAGVSLDLDQVTALCFAAAVAIRVLGRAGHDRRLLQEIANGATAAVRRAVEP
jgi:TetR/AcrR family transcriptional repressor of nem operon